jgi:hypothetical protein
MLARLQQPPVDGLVHVLGERPVSTAELPSLRQCVCDLKADVFVGALRLVEPHRTTPCTTKRDPSAPRIRPPCTRRSNSAS